MTARKKKKEKCRRRVLRRVAPAGLGDLRLLITLSQSTRLSSMARPPL